eukprot:gene2080-7873_t
MPGGLGSGGTRPGAGRPAVHAGAAYSDETAHRVRNMLLRGLTLVTCAMLARRMAAFSAWFASHHDGLTELGSSSS